jgi:hypothetical protein
MIQTVKKDLRKRIRIQLLAGVPTRRAGPDIDIPHCSLRNGQVGPQAGRAWVSV